MFGFINRVDNWGNLATIKSMSEQGLWQLCWETKHFLLNLFFVVVYYFGNDRGISIIIDYFSWRENLKILLKDINHQKKLLKVYGIVIDGKHYHVQFVSPASWDGKISYARAGSMISISRLHRNCLRCVTHQFRLKNKLCTSWYHH